MGQNDDKIQQQILQRYEIVKKIGCGAYGVVWKVIDKKYKTIHALKKNFDAFQNSTDAQRTYRQIMFLQEFKHPNIVALQKIIKAQNEKDIYLVFQFMDIDLYTLIRQNILQEKHKRYIIYQVAKAIFYLHTGQLIHRDIKPSNILVNQSCLAKMCDFGLVRSVQDNLEEQQPFLTQYIATRWYRAPQILLGSKKYSKAVDVWSFGCLIGQIIKGRPLFPGNSTLNQIQRVLTWTGPPTINDMKSLKTDFGKQMLDLLSKIKRINKAQWFQNISNSGYDLLSKTLQFNPQKRITMLQVLQHPYLRQFYNEQEILRADSKIRIPVDDNKKLSTKDYRSLIYKNIKQTQEQSNISLVTSLGPSKNLVPKKSQSNQKDHQSFQRQGATKTVHKNRMYKGTIFNQTSTQKSKIHSLGTSNKSIHKKNEEFKQFKKNIESSKKYESLINKRKDLTKTKYIKTQQKQRQDVTATNKYNNSTNKNEKQHYNNHNNDIFAESQTNSRFASSADKGKKSVSLNEGRRQSQVIAKYMYKHKYF